MSPVHPLLPIADARGQVMERPKTEVLPWQAAEKSRSLHSHGEDMFISIVAHTSHHLRSVPMRGDNRQQEAMFRVLSPEQRVPADHPLRRMREMVDRVLVELSPEFDSLYARRDRPSIRPEKLLRRCCCRSCTPCGASAC